MTEADQSRLSTTKQGALGVTQSFSATKKFTAIRLNREHASYIESVLGVPVIWRYESEMSKELAPAVESRRRKQKSGSFLVRRALTSPSIDALAEATPRGRLPHIAATAHGNDWEIELRLGSPMGFSRGSTHSAEISVRGSGVDPPPAFEKLLIFLRKRADRTMVRWAFWYFTVYMLAIYLAGRVYDFLQWADADARRQGLDSPVPGILVLLGVILTFAIPIAVVTIRRLTGSSVLLRRRFGLRGEGDEIWIDYKREMRLWIWGNLTERNFTHAVTLSGTIAQWLALVVAVVALVLALN